MAEVIAFPSLSSRVSSGACVTQSEWLSFSGVEAPVAADEADLVTAMAAVGLDALISAEVAPVLRDSLIHYAGFSRQPPPETQSAGAAPTSAAT